MLLAGAAFALVPGCRAETGTAMAGTRAVSSALVPLTIKTRQGSRTFRVEIARTELQQERGLMFRTSLPDHGGMVFPMTPPRPATFWMKNTPLPLDIIFIRADGTIARIAARTTPYSLDMIESGEPVAAVLEIIGGGAQAAGIFEGDKVSWADR
jgi:uncharacterized membrane protein (UPF0127 family)